MYPTKVLAGLFCFVTCGNVLCGETNRSVAETKPAAAEEAKSAGHSMHGEAFNEGPRQKAYLMEGMPKINFAVTTKSSEAQSFFNQGVGQLHGFWYFEAERSFRQAAALDPEMAMSYWGMAMANVQNEKRAQSFIKLASDRKASASKREQLWIESLAGYYADLKKKPKERRTDLIKALENIVYEYPDDVEAKAFLAFQIWDNRNVLPISSHQAVDALIQQIFAVQPMHPAHHYQIHLWNRDRDIRSIGSAAKCGQTSPGVAHMWHMSGHIYSELKRYSDAAWQQEASARVDHAHMIRDRVMPDQIHNYAHNNEWLVQNLSYIGRLSESIDLAKNMVELPRLKDEGRSSYALGRAKLFEILPQFEQWDQIIALAETPYLEPTDKQDEQVKRLRSLGVAWLNKGDLKKGQEQAAALAEIKKTLKAERAAAADAAEEKAIKEKKPADQVAKAMTDALQSFRKRLDTVDEAIQELTLYEALVKKDFETIKKARGQKLDIPKERLARLFAEASDSEKALQLAKEAVESAPGQVQPLANYINLLAKFERKPEAKEQFAKLRAISAYIELNLPVMERLSPLAKEWQGAEDWRIAASKPTDVGMRPDLSTLGPFRWHPSAAESWSLPDMQGSLHSLSEFQGKPVLLIFYLGAGCPHCIEQLNSFAPVAKDFEAAGISLVAVSTDTVPGLKDTFAQSKTDGTFPFLIVSDESLATFKAYRAFDDFEAKPLHGTFLLDANHLVRWQDISFEPYKETAFLLKEAKRLLGLQVSGAAGDAGPAIAVE